MEVPLSSAVTVNMSSRRSFDTCANDDSSHAREPRPRGGATTVTSDDASQHFHETTIEIPTANPVVMTAARSSPSTTSRASDGISVITMDRMAVDHASPIAQRDPFRIAKRVVDTISPLRALSMYDMSLTVLTQNSKHVPNQGETESNAFQTQTHRRRDSLHHVQRTDGSDGVLHRLACRIRVQSSEGAHDRTRVHSHRRGARTHGRRLWFGPMRRLLLR